MDFLQNINCEVFQDTSDLLSSSKEQLVQVKQVYKDLDNEIKVLSQQNYHLEVEINDKSKRLEELTKEEEELKEKHEKLCHLGEILQINDNLNGEIDKIENDIKEIYQKIDLNREFISSLNLKSKIEEEQSLKEIKHELAAKQKRLTIINTESYMEDIYSWYEEVCEFFKKIFGGVELQMVEDRCIIKLGYNDGTVEIILKNKKLHEVNFNCSVSEELMNQIEECKSCCVQINDLRMLFALLIEHKKN